MKKMKWLLIAAATLLTTLAVSCVTSEKASVKNPAEFKRTHSVEDGDKYLSQAIYYHYELKDILKAINACIKARLIFEKYSPAKLSVCLHELGMLYEEIGQYSKAISCSLEGIALDKQFGNKSDLAGKYGNLAIAYGGIGSHFKAIECIEKAIAINTELNDKLNLCVSYFNLASIYLDIERYDDALTYYKIIITIIESNPIYQKKSLVNRKSVEAGIFKAHLLSGNSIDAKRYLEIINTTYKRPFCSGLYHLHSGNYIEAVTELKSALKEDYAPMKPVVSTSGKGGSLNLEFKLQAVNNPVKQHLIGKDDKMACHIGLGRAYELSGDLTNAAISYNEVISRGEKQRALLSIDQRKYFYSKKLYGFTLIDAYEGALRVKFKQGQFEDAYLLSETISSRLFSEEYAQRSKTKNSYGEIPEELKSKEKRLNELIEEISKRQLARDVKEKDDIDRWYQSK